MRIPSHYPCTALASRVTRGKPGPRHAGSVGGRATACVPASQTLLRLVPFRLALIAELNCWQPYLVLAGRYGAMLSLAILLSIGEGQSERFADSKAIYGS
jgi:hypothetical protein